MDTLTRAGRSAFMRRIRGDRFGPESRLESALAGVQAEYSRNDKSLLGSPDFAFHAARLAVFVDGCFWHGCPRHARLPAANRAFWLAKLAANRARDRRQRAELRRRSWRVLAVWEHQTRGQALLRAASLARRLAEAS